MTTRQKGHCENVAKRRPECLDVRKRILCWPNLGDSSILWHIQEFDFCVIIVMCGREGVRILGREKWEYLAAKDSENALLRDLLTT